MMSEHASFEELSALVDGALAADDAAAIERHVAGCVVCRGELSRLRAVLARVAALPSTIEPPAEAWSAIRATLNERTDYVTRRPLGVPAWMLRAAAALLLVVGSSALTVLVLRWRAPATMAVAPSRAPTPAAPAAVHAVERSYADVVEELTAAVHAQREKLAPETLATLERTLRVIDDAIAEARAALAADPRNDTLVDVLSANYEQKVQLLRRASELPART